MKNHSQLKLGLALGGGGARGLAHIGVLKALEEAGISVDFLSGTSMGGVIAGAYATGLSPDEIQAMALEYSDSRTLWRLADPTLPRQGLFRGERLHAYFEKQLGGSTFESLRIPLTLVAVDLNRGCEVHMNAGSLADAVRATVSVPGLLAPIQQDGQCLVDGALLNNVPTDVVRHMGADVVLAVDVYSESPEEPSYWQLLGKRRFLADTIGDLLRILGDSLNLVIQHQNAYKMQESPPDFLIRPVIPPDVGLISGYDRAPLLIAKGKKAVTPVLPNLNAALKIIH
ncbi:MAG: patatin-like phospholipase family protein [Anaerolineae bacterium]|nr:patatin-like phospholipase family protein [Anaerolineae bacterium]